MNRKLLLFRVLFITVILILFMIHRSVFYYIILDKNNLYRYDELLSICKYIDICNADIEVFKDRAETEEVLHKEGKIIKYNNAIKSKNITNPIEAIKTAKECFLYIDYGTEKFTGPYFVTYNSNADVWIVQENIYKKKLMYGGEFAAVIDSKNGKIIYAVHFLQ